MKKTLTFALTTAISLVGLGGVLSSCEVGSSIAQLTPRPKPVTENIVGLLFVKRDNLTQNYRAEILPIARYANGRYQDASLDVTPAMHQGTSEAAIVKANLGKSVLNPNQTFTAYQEQSTLGEFKVNRLGVGQFACSAMLIGRADQSQANLKSAFKAIPRDRETGGSGYVFGKQVDETWRFGIAAHHSTPSVAPQSTDLKRYSRDITATATTILNRNLEARKIAGGLVVENVQAYDLDRDGQPEIFAQVRKGQDPKTISSSRRDRGRVTAVYAALWLSYKTGTPTVIASEGMPYTYPVSRHPSDILGVVDVNGDGIDEVIVRVNDYESTSFSILEYEDKQLRSVFTVPGYGC